MNATLYNYDSEQVKERIRQLMKEMGVKEYIPNEKEKAAASTATR